MNRKRTATHMDASDHQKQRCTTELRAQLAGAKEQLAAIDKRLNREREKRKLAEERCADRLRFVTLLTELSARFVSLPADQIDAAIRDAQLRICNILDLDRSVLWQITDRAPVKMVQSHVHQPPEAKLPESPTQVSDQFPWIVNQILQGQMVAITSLQKLPPEADRDRKSLSRWGSKSTLVLPLSVSDEIIGALSFSRLRVEATWDEEIVKRLRLVPQLFINALARQQFEESLDARLRFEDLLVEISARFVNLPADRIDAEIEDAQQLICKCLGIDLSALWQWSDDAPHYLTLTHLYSPPEGPERPEGIDAKAAFPWVLKKALQGKVQILSTESMPPEAAHDQEMRRHFGVKSSVVIPLSAGNGPLIGVLTFDALKEERSWPAPIVKNLCLVTQIFSNALARKRGDLQLRESEARLNMATNAAGIGLWVMEIDSSYVWVNPKNRELFGFDTDEELSYNSFKKVIHPEDFETVNRAVQAAIQTSDMLTCEYRIVAPDGSIRWIAARGKRYLGTNGKQARLMGVSININERKQMEEQLIMRLAEIENLKQKLEKENIYLRKEIELTAVHKEIVGRSPAIRRVLAQVEQVAQTDTTVLIEGETGTGKDLLARAVHQLSARNKRPLVTVNCASLPPTLIESELFGREKGAYTGAMTRMTGRFEVADGATLFLDEIGELPLDVQAKLLRVLEQGHFERLGSNQAMKVDVRIIAASNLDLEKQVAAGRFRKDLYYRLNVFPILLPPLRERPEDIPSLVLAFVRQYEKKMGKRIDRIPRPCMNNLQRYAWPGNIRELRNVIERALIVTNGRTLEVRLPRGAVADVPENLKLHAVERRHITEVLQQTGWRLSGQGGAADVLGLKRTTLQSKMKKLGIQRAAR